MSERIGFIGGGQMARALARGFVIAKVVQAAHLIASDPIAEARAAFEKETGGRATGDSGRVIEASDVVFLAVKPQAMAEVLAAIAPKLTSKHLIVSIAAGVSLAKLAQGLGAERRIVRVMPNTPCLVGQSASGYALGSAASEVDGEQVARLMGAVGVAARVSEPLLDAVTGLSGSGPAYIYQVIEALSDGGVKAGLPRDIATRLAAQTVLGAAQMVLSTGQHTGELKDMVTSPGGTTIAGLAVLERSGVRGAFIDAVVAATERARELGKF